MLRYALVGALVLATVGTLQTETTLLPVSTEAQIVFVHPSAWRAKLERRPVGQTATFDAKAHDFKLLVTAGVAKNPGKADVEAVVREMGDALLPSATQEKVELVPVDGPQAKGFLFHFTDRNEEKGPGDYREMHQGVVAVGPCLLKFTILTHTGDDATVAEAIKVVRGATYREGSK